MPFSQIIPPSPSPTESKRLFYTSVSLLLSRTLVTPPTPPRVPSGDPRSRPVTLAVPPPFTVKETEVECSGLACRVMTDEWL